MKNIFHNNDKEINNKEEGVTEIMPKAEKIRGVKCPSLIHQEGSH
jgi:hypothetical protein